MASVAAGITVKSVLLKVGKAVGVYLAGKLLDKATDALSGSTRESVVRRIEGQKVNVRSTQASLPVVYGIQRVGLIVNDVRNASSPGTFFAGATGKDVLVKSGAIAIGSEDGSGIQAVDNIRVYDDGDYAITSPASFPSSAVNTNVATPYTNYLKYIIQDGDDAQTLPSDLGTAMGWGADYKARGVAYGAFFCLYNENVWKRGVPQITMDVTGNRVYDPRTSSWIGYNASGASSDNPALCILDYLTSKRYGAGIPYAARDGGALDFIDAQSFEDAADYCDVLVNTYTAGPQEKRFRMNAVVDTSRVVSANLVEMLATCRGELVWQNGKYRLIIRQAQTAQSFELTEDNIVGSLDWTRKGTSVPNLIEATFPNESGDDYVADSIQFPPVGTTTYLDEDNGIENRLEIALPYTTSIYQAQRTVETMLKELRADVYVTLTATQAAYTLQVGDVVNVTHSGPQWAQKPFVVRSVALTADGLVGLGLQEYDSTAYTLTTPDQESADDAIDLPDPQRAFITISMAGDRFVSQGATTSGGVAAQQWKRRLNFRTGINTRSVNIVYDFDRPDIGDVTSTNFSRNYTINVTADSEVTHILEDGASGEQIFLARDDNGNTKYDEAISVTITPNDTTGGGGQDGTVVTTQILDLALEDDLGFRVDAEVEVVEANYAEANGDAWFSFTTSIAYWAQGFTMPAGTDRDLASVEVYLQRVGSPTGDVNLYVYDNNTTPTPDEPNTSVAAATTSVDASTLSASGQVVRLDMDRVSLTAGGSYWVVVEHIDSSGTDYVQIRVDESSPNGSDMTDTATSPEIVSWTVSNSTVRQAAGFYVRRFGTQVVPTRQLAPAADKSAKFTWQADGTVALASVTSGGGGGGATTLAGLTDTTITTPGAGDFLRYSGLTWLNTTLVAGDIPSLDAAKITAGTFADALIAASNVTQHVGAIDHDSLLNFVANEHVDHSGVSISTGDGLSGGGDITATRTLTLDIDGLDDVTLETAPDDKLLGADQLVFSRGSGLFKSQANDIPLGSFLNDQNWTANAIEDSGVGTNEYTSTTQRLGIKYDGTTNFINARRTLSETGGADLTKDLVGTAISGSDYILYHDFDDAAGGVKVGEVSDLPFLASGDAVETLTSVTNGGISVGGTATDVTLDLNIVDLSLTATSPTGLDSLPFHLDGGDSRRILFEDIDLTAFNDDLGYTTVTASLGAQRVVNDIRINYGSGADGLIGAAPNTGVIPVGLDALLIGDGGLTSAVESIQFSDIPLSIMNTGNFVESNVDETITGTWTFPNTTDIGVTSQSYDTLAATDWDRGVGTHVFVNASTSTGEPSGASRGYWFTMGRRDTQNGYAGLYLEVGNTLWLGERDNNTVDGAPTWVEVANVGHVHDAGTDITTGTLPVARGGTGLSDSPANDQLLVSLGPGNGWEGSGSGLTWNGTTLNATNFTGNGSGLSGVNADNFDVTNLTTEVDTYYPMFTDGVSTGVSGFVNSTDLRWKNTATANQLLLANGAEATPILAFINDEDTGIFGNTAEVSVATGGTERFRVTNGSVQSYESFFVIRPTGNSVMSRFRREDNTDLAWDQRIDTGGAYEIRAVTDAGTTVPNGVVLQLEHATGDLTLKGWIRSEDGSAGDPTYSFSNDADTGMYLSSTGTVAFASGGAIKAYVGANEFRVYHKIENADGTVGDPTYSFNSDTDTGMYLGSTGVLKFSTAGADRLAVSGTSIDVYQDIVMSANETHDIGSTTNRVDNIWSSIYYVKRANASPTIQGMRDDATIAAGNTLLQVSSGADLGSGWVLGAQIVMSSDEIWAQGTNSGSSMRFYTTTNGTWNTDVERMRIDHDGQVGIGETNPATLLHLSNSAGGNILRLQDTGGAGNTANPYLDFRDSAATRLAYVGMGSTGNSILYINNDTAGSHIYASFADSATSGDFYLYNQGTTDVPTLTFANADEAKGYLQATDAGTVTLATSVANASINIRDNGSSFNLATFDHNGSYVTSLSSPTGKNDVLRINTVDATGSPYVAWTQNNTQRAYIQFLDSSDLFRINLSSSSTHNFAVQAGGTTKFYIDSITATQGYTYFANGQVYAAEYQTQYEDTGTPTLDWRYGNQLLMDFDSTSTTTTIDIGDTTMNAGGSYILLMQYNGGSAQTVAWTSSTPLIWANSDVPTTATGATAGDITVVQFFKTTTATDKIIGSYFVVT